MEQALPYRFKRRSKNHFDWLLNVIKSEKYHEAESIIVEHTYNKMSSSAQNFNKSSVF
ncbi:hypothetical protein [Mangrovimonas xylaniphaga]|uniref:hypothetical protein n=1 Tax=Mangrovimonas xylaniphaga TaxID=1645915 RepID=UPI000A6F8C6A|nr:hypothetical protein [Mangrovimonas xylaniphaga]